MMCIHTPLALEEICTSLKPTRPLRMAKLRLQHYSRFQPKGRGLKPVLAGRYCASSVVCKAKLSHPANAPDIRPVCNFENQWLAIGSEINAE